MITLATDCLLAGCFVALLAIQSWALLQRE